MFEIKTKEGKINMSSDQLFQTILKQCFVDHQNDNLQNVKNYIEVITKIVKTNLLEANLSQLLSIYFMAGYYYKVFLNQNEVTINNKNKE
jgi:hypothetical protein